MGSDISHSRGSAAKASELMHAVLQDWTEIEGFGLPDVIQSGSSWLRLDAYQDVTFFLEVRLKQNAELALDYETALSFDPGVWWQMARVVMSVSSTPLMTRILLSEKTGVNDRPLMGLVRWHIVPVTASADWRVNFRITCVAKGAR
jgi:hypothetical protein